jgi:hypothetical protein
LLTLPEVPGQFWTVKWVGKGTSGKDVVVAPTQQEAIAKWIREKGSDARYFLHIERTPHVG